MIKLLRSIAAVFLGYVVFAVSALALFQLSGRNPHAGQSTGFIVFTVVYGMVFAWLGARLAMKIAASHPARHATALALLIATGATVSMLTSPAADQSWSQWTALLLMAPSAWFAGRGRAA